MNFTDTPDDLPAPDEEPPDFDALDSPEEVLKGGPTRERVLDVVLQLREPTAVSTIAERADCDTETARDYLEWFTEMGVVREHAGRPVQYERNDSFLRWRRIESIRQEYTQPEIVELLQETVDAAARYREQFDADTPDQVSLADATDEETVAERWEALSEWQTLETRAELLDAARRESASTSSATRIDV
jgi:predicted ArsR family transcriptional regulator